MQTAQNICVILKRSLGGCDILSSQWEDNILANSTTSLVTIETDPANQFPTGSKQAQNRLRTDSEQTQNRLRTDSVIFNVGIEKNYL